MVEPDAKRLKIEKMIIKSVLPDELTEAIKLTTAFVGCITDAKRLSKIMTELSKKLPLKSLHHLKRVKQHEVIICEQNDVTSAAEIKNLFEQNGIEKGIFSYFLSFNLQQVPSHAPKLRHQYEEAIRYWPCKFHPNHYLEKSFKNELFSDEEAKFHVKMMKVCLSLSNFTAAGIAVNPKIKRIAALGLEATEQHPLQHCPMVLIDRVAVSQNGGAWFDGGGAKAGDDNWNYQGCSAELIEMISKQFPAVEFGAQHVITSGTVSQEDVNPHDDNLGKYGPYLCTGYDLYFTKEPCVMCAMALIHSRAKRIFYHRTTEKGALGSLTKLHTVGDLNHHYEVFQIS
jgi:tRNA-specific adenosine deaminase 3